MANDRTYQQFTEEVHHLLNGKAEEKHYNQTGPDSQNKLYEFVQDTIGSDGHALGEIVYKVKRYAALGNPEDILKVAAWAFLVWKHRQ